MKKQVRFRTGWQGFILACLVAGLLGDPTPVAAVSYKFASPSGTPADACTYTDPCDLQTAVNDSSSGGLVYLASGTYHPYTLPSDMVVLIDKSLHLYGGWDGVSGPDPGIPDYWNVPASIIDGENVRQGVVIYPGYHDVVTLSGLTVQNGNATGKIAMCTAVNAAGCGGGIMILSGTVTIEDSIIEDNVASTTTDATYKTGYGGGIYVQEADILNPIAVTLQDNIIRSNDASTASSGPVGSNGSGGAIFVGGVLEQADLTISHNEIALNNAATSTYSGLGDGLLIYGQYGTVSQNHIHDNNPNLRTNGSTLFATHADLNITGNRLIDNHGSSCLYLIDFNGMIVSNLVDNPDVWYGMVLETNTAPRFATLTNNIIAHHSATNLFLTGSASNVVTANLYHNTLDASPYGVYAYQYAYTAISNSILSNHLTAGVFKNSVGNTINVAYTLFYGNTSDGDADMDIVSHKLTGGDPLYVNASARNYHIQAGSAARDVAPGIGFSYDFEGDPRPMGTSGTPYDVGADEFWWKIYLPAAIKP